MVGNKTFKNIAKPEYLWGNTIEDIGEVKKNPRKMSIDLTRLFIAARVPITFHGPPGSGKSATIDSFREITDEEMQKACQLLGYQYRSAVAGESLGDPIRDGANSFNVYADFTKSRRDDLGDAYYDLENGIGTMIKEGSPIRKTDRSGPGTKGTRLVDGLGDGLNPQLYYS